MNPPVPPLAEFDVLIHSHDVTLEGEFILPLRATGLVIFAHGSGNSRLSLRNHLLAAEISRYRIAALLVNLLTPEEAKSRGTPELSLLADRLIATTRWVQNEDVIARLPIGYFGSGSGAAAALAAASQVPDVRCVVLRGGFTASVDGGVGKVKAATLFIAGELDHEVIRQNEVTYRHLSCPKNFAAIPRATHLFTEPGALEEVAELAAGWFRDHLGRPVRGQKGVAS